MRRAKRDCNARGATTVVSGHRGPDWLLSRGDTPTMRLTKENKERVGNELWSGRIRQALERVYDRQIVDAMIECLVRGVG